MSEVKETEMKPLHFEVQGPFILNLARQAYWMENRRVWAKELLGELSGITEEQKVALLNGDAELVGWDRTRNGKQEHIRYKVKENRKWKIKVEDQKKYLAERFIEITTDRFLTIDSLAALLTYKHRLLRMIAEGNKGRKMLEVDEGLEQVDEEEDMTIYRIIETMNDAGFGHVEKDDVKQFMNAMRQRYDIKDAAALKNDVEKTMNRLAHNADVREDSPDKQAFLATLEKKANIIHKYDGLPTHLAVPDALRAIKEGLDETSDVRIAFGHRIAGSLFKDRDTD